MVSYTEKEMTISSIASIAIGSITGFGIGLLLMAHLADNTIDKIMQEAIEANVAKWTIDEKTGERSFRFGSVVNKTHL